MIGKELDPFQSKDVRLKAGREAEEKMAHYLRRAFGDDPKSWVLNGVRIEHRGDVAQMDHLLIHPFGICVIESKSVKGEIQITNDGQWLRRYSNNSSPMQCPINQAKLQAEFLKKYLCEKFPEIGLFRSNCMSVIIAISDSGLILWPDSGPIAEVCKADQVVKKLGEIIASGYSGKPQLEDEQIYRVAQFLKQAHQPYGYKKQKTEFQRDSNIFGRSKQSKIDNVDNLFAATGFQKKGGETLDIGHGAKGGRKAPRRKQPGIQGKLVSVALSMVFAYAAYSVIIRTVQNLLAIPAQQQVRAAASPAQFIQPAAPKAEPQSRPPVMAEPREQLQVDYPKPYPINPSPVLDSETEKRNQAVLLELCRNRGECR